MPNLNATKFIEENIKYLDAESVDAIRHLTDTQFAALVDMNETLTGGTDPGVDCDVQITAETVQDWIVSSKTWHSLGSRDECVGGVIFRESRPVKGQQRCDIAVMALECGKSLILTV